KRQPGFIATQLHRGIAGSNVFLNHAVWESVARVRAAFAGPAFQARLAAYPDTVAVSPHLFRPVAVPSICIA
ncbi:antibiotic biosynthesis monooxygenase family protein, partial [Methylobacterium sp. A54F]